MVQVQKWPFFQTFFFRQYRAGKCLLQYCRTRKRLSRLKKKDVEKVEINAFQGHKNKKFKKLTNCHFSKRVNPCFRSKNGHFSKLFCLGNIGNGKCLLRYSRTKKKLFQAIETRISKSRKIEIFPKRLNHGFGPKIALFPNFFLANIGQENVFYDILQRKNTFLGHKISFTIFQNEKTSFQAIKTKS